jgi:hypothetical protein
MKFSKGRNLLELLVRWDFEILIYPHNEQYESLMATINVIMSYIF